MSKTKALALSLCPLSFGEGCKKPDLGDEAFFGMMSTLYVREGKNVFIRIVPPNLRWLAQAQAVAKINTAGAGRRKAKGDPIQSANGNDMQGALGYLKATKHTGTVYETKGRAMAVALANKLLGKL